MADGACATFSFSLIVLLLVLPVTAFLGLVSYILWYTLNSNSGVQFTVSWQGKPLVAWELQNIAPDWKCYSTAGPLSISPVT